MRAGAEEVIHLIRIAEVLLEQVSLALEEPALLVQCLRPVGGGAHFLFEGPLMLCCPRLAALLLRLPLAFLRLALAL
jgi:hypothetical protein